MTSNRREKSIQTILDYLMNSFGPVMKTSEVCKAMKRSPTFVDKIPMDKLPRSVERGSRGTTFLATDVALFMFNSVHGEENQGASSEKVDA